MNSKNGFKQAYIAICVAGIFAASAAQANNTLQDGNADTGADISAVETVTVIGTRKAYRGEFSPLETPQSELLISSEVLANAGAFDLVQALDLSSSVSRQNNFGGLWNSFAEQLFG
jgi:iron complex outermembrane receptor protein